MHVGQVLAAHIAAKFPDRLQKRQGFDVAHGAADLGDHHIGIAVGRYPLDAFADFAGDVGNHLHGAAVVIAAALLVDHRLVDRSGRHAVEARHGGVGKPFVVAQVEVGFSPVFGHEDFAVLVRAHRARIHVEVGVQLENRNAVPARLQQPSQAGRDDAFADAGDHTAGNKDKFAHGASADSSIYR